MCFFYLPQFDQAMILIKSPCFEAFTLSDKNIIFTGSRQEIIHSKKEFLNIIDLANFCIEPRSLSEVTEFIFNKNIDSEALDYAVKNKILINNHIDLSNRYSRNDIYLEYQGIDSKSLRKKISSMNILIAGCGGIGNIMSYNMVSLGAQNILLLDDDTVEESNLNRQVLFNECDIGRKKVDALKDRLTSINSTLKIKKIDSNLEKINLQSQDISLIILSADSENSLQIISKLATANKIPLISVGYLADISCIGPFYLPDISSCPMCNNIYTDTNDEIDPRLKNINNHYKAPSAPMNNFLAAIMATNDIVNYISGNKTKIKSLNRRYGINSFTFEHDYIECPVSNNCQYCA